jgi:phage repressor protein C with HTH and peptisase S24 domain
VQQELQQAISNVPPATSLSQTSITSSTISDAANIAAGMKAAGVNLAELDIDTATHITDKDEADEATLVQTEEPEDEAAATRPKEHGAAAKEGENEQLADVSMSVEVSEDEDNWPDYVEDDSLDEQQN